MSNVAIFDEGNNRILDFKKSVNTPSYEGRTDVLINPDVSALADVPKKYWLHDSGAIREMTQGEKDALDAFLQSQADDDLRDKIDAFDVDVVDIFTAWLQLYNGKVPAGYQVSGAEMKAQIKTNKGL